MLRIIFLLLPVFISLFWALALAGDKKNHSVPRIFLAKFMLLPSFCLGVHFLYFAPLAHIYPYFDVPLQLIGNLIFPVFYIYFRLLTVDQQFSWRLHGVYLAIPSIIPFVSAVAVFFTPWQQFTVWLFDSTAFASTPHIQTLVFLRKVLNIQFLVVVMATFIASSRLLSKHGDKAEQYYSDLKDGKYNNAKLLNFSVLLVCVASFSALAVGRYFLMPKEIMLYLLWAIFAFSLYLIGYMGMKQKPVNPTFDVEETPLLTADSINIHADSHLIVSKLLKLFELEKMHLNSQLTIMDVVAAIGTNRTYISAAINQQYGQNFCNFVNTFRLKEVEKVICQDPKLSYESLAECCGFGSVSTLKRAVLLKTGLSISEWKKTVLGVV